MFVQRTALSCDLAAPPAALRLRSRFCAALAPYALILVSLVPWCGRQRGWCCDVRFHRPFCLVLDVLGV